MQRTLAAALVLALAAIAPPAHAAPCDKDEIGSTVCPGGKNGEYRVIRGTVSPTKRYAIAWNTGSGKTRYDFEMINGNGPYGRYSGTDAATFLVRIDDGTMLRQLNGTHLGDAQRYNHRRIATFWSPNESWLVAVNESKWSTDVADAYRLGPGGASESIDLLPLCLEAERHSLKGRKVDFEQFAQRFTVKALGEDGTLSAVCHMEIPKQDDSYQFLVRFKLDQTAKGVTAKLGAIKRCKDLTGDCALPDVVAE